jgi:hypothetical protein
MSCGAGLARCAHQRVDGVARAFQVLAEALAVENQQPGDAAFGVARARPGTIEPTVVGGRSWASVLQ